MKKQAYSYVVLRYVHDIVTGEFVNVGVVLVAPTSGTFFARTRKTIGRLRSIFPDLEKQAFLEAMRSIDRGEKSIRKEVSNEGLFAGEKSAADYARRLVPVDDSSLRWSSEGTGISDDIDSTLARLFERFVSRYDKSSPQRRSDEDVWRPVRDMLAERGVEIELESKVVVGNADSIEFRHVWRNGRLHAYEPVSFDLADADGIKDKARRWRGHLAAVADGLTDSLQLHFLLGRPDNDSLAGAYENAIDILKGAPFNPTIFDDSQVAEFVDDIEGEVRAHYADVGH